MSLERLGTLDRLGTEKLDQTIAPKSPTKLSQRKVRPDYRSKKLDQTIAPKNLDQTIASKNSTWVSRLPVKARSNTARLEATKTLAEGIRDLE